MEPDNCYFHISELGEWTPKLSEELMGLESIPGPPITMFHLSLTPEQMKRLLPEAFDKEPK